MTVHGIGRLVVRTNGVEVERRCVRDATAPETVAALRLVGQVQYTRPGELPADDDLAELLTRAGVP